LVLTFFLLILIICWNYSFQTRPGPRPGFRVLPGHRVGQVNSFFKKSKRRRFSKKNKSQRVATGFLTGSCWVTPGFSLPYFFFNPGPGSIRRTGPGFKTMIGIKRKNRSSYKKTVKESKKTIVFLEHLLRSEILRNFIVVWK
jgi:hypothetical protein